LLQSLNYLFQNSISVSKDIVIPDPQHLVAPLFQPCCPGLIFFPRLFRIVLSTINLKYKSLFVANEINNIGPYALLPAEFYVMELPTSQPCPQDSFGVCCLSAKPSANSYSPLIFFHWAMSIE